MNVRSAAISSLQAWEKGHDYAETLVDRYSQRGRLSSVDRAFLQSLLFGTLRNLRLLDHWISILRDGKLDAETRNVLRLGLFQVLLLRIADHAAVNETVEAAKRSVRPLVNAVLRRAIANREAFLAELDSLPPAIRFSHPDWLFQRISQSYGNDRAALISQHNNLPAETYFSENPLSSHALTLPAQAIPLTEVQGHYRLEGPLPKDLLEEGQIYIQDPATRHCVKLLDPKPGEEILDACAAPGGKAFQIAAAQGSGSTLTCTDSNSKRVPRLEKNLQRLQITPAEISVHDWTNPAPAKYLRKFDAILLDVPCSNTGVLRRRVDARWRIKENSLRDLTAIQLAILENALPCLAPHGRIVYSTCSIEPEENQSLVERFADMHSAMTLVSTNQFLPAPFGTDGAFAALLQKKT